MAFSGRMSRARSVRSSVFEIATSFTRPAFLLGSEKILERRCDVAGVATAGAGGSKESISSRMTRLELSSAYCQVDSKF